MIARGITWGIVVLTCFIALSRSADVFVSVPQTPHYDAEFTATVSTYGIEKTEKVFLEYTGVLDRSRVLNSTTMTFSTDGVQTWTIRFSWKRMESLSETGVRLLVACSGYEKEMQLFFSPSTGYIFIQTDKPIYTPRQTVKFRIIAVDEYQRLADFPLKVDIQNEKSIVVDRTRYTSMEAFKGQEFPLPRETPEGNWTITASYEGMSGKSASHSVNFEVREYVLPRFSASVYVDKDVITKDTNWITITVLASYVYGRTLKGSGEMEVGIWDAESGVTLLPLRFKGELKDGKWKQDLRVGALIPRSQIKNNRRLYVSVNVTEYETFENYTCVDTSTVMADTYYDITFPGSKIMFKPGFPYTLHIRVRSQGGRLASRMQIWLALHIKDTNNRTAAPRRSQLHQLDAKGEFTMDVNMPENAYWLEVKIIVIDFKVGGWNQRVINIPRLESKSKEYLRISLIQPVKSNSQGVVKLQYSVPEKQFIGVSRPLAEVTLQVVAKGYVLFSTGVTRTKLGESRATLPNWLYAEASPSMRIVGYYLAHSHDYITDSLQVETKQVCLEELSLSSDMVTSNVPMKPKDIFQLNVKGGPSMMVGFVAVDKAVLRLNDRETLTRRSMFQEFKNHDQGKGTGEGKDLPAMMKNCGLRYIVIDTKATMGDGVSTGHLTSDGEDSHFPSFGNRGDKMTKTNGHFFWIRPDDRVSVGEGSNAPPQTVRNYFPESWLFEEKTLPKSGNLKLQLPLPDSITTWSFMAVGVSSTRGVCVSNRLEQEVEKLFFAEIRLPYKATRLEQVKAKIVVYNYQTYTIDLTVRVTGSDGLCFSDNEHRGDHKKGTSFKMVVPSQSLKSHIVKVIPLRNGELKLKAEIQNPSEKDIVEKKIHVVAEGRRVRKSLTFVLDPEAKHASFKAKRRTAKITMTNTTTISNLIDKSQHTQQTKINLALPKEVIGGTEYCRISAFGDLVGDIINYVVVESKSLMEREVMDAEEVLGDLGPTVQALKYANISGLLNEELRSRSRRFVRMGVMRLLRYRQGSAFSLSPDAPAGTWLTAVAVKTLCHASEVAFIDKSILIDDAIDWLRGQIMKDGRVKELDWRLADNSFDYQVMLSAEVLIAFKECQSAANMDLQRKLADFMKSSIDKLVEPMILAKVTYALTLFEPNSRTTLRAVQKLKSVRRRTLEGQFYWSKTMARKEQPSVPYWYRKGVKAFSIEATAFALMVFLEHPKVNEDAIADWLVGQRKYNGAFNGAMDTIAAIQALSSYSIKKHGLKVDLLCNVTSDRKEKQKYSFKFTKQNAMRPESLNDVPVGQTLDVITKGQGLGQMQVNVEYNVPIDENKDCPFNVTVQVEWTNFYNFDEMYTNPICAFCNIGCKKPKVEEANVTDTSTTVTPATTTPKLTAKMNRKVEPVVGLVAVDPMPMSMRSSGTQPLKELKHEKKKSKNNRKRCSAANRRAGKCGSKSSRKSKSRKPRSYSMSSSRDSICVHVCLRHLEGESSGPTKVEIEMLTGYVPVHSDIERIRSDPNVRQAVYLPERDVVIVHFTKVTEDGLTCVAYRAVDEENVDFQAPAQVLISEIGDPDPLCVLEYHAPEGRENLQVYCADATRSNRGECRCFSGLCSSCPRQQLSFHDVKKLTCEADIVYQLLLSETEAKERWTEINSQIVSANKTGIQPVSSNQLIQLISPGFCQCPLGSFSRLHPVYMMSPNVEKLMDKYGTEVYRYLLDETTTFLKVLPPGMYQKSGPAVPFAFMKSSLDSGNDC